VKLLATLLVLGGYVVRGVCLFVYLSVCLLATSRKISTDRILTKILPKTYIYSRFGGGLYSLSALVDIDMRVSTAQPSFVITPRDKTVSRGQSVVVRCVVIGNPTPTTYWNALNTQVYRPYYLQRGGLYVLPAFVCLFVYLSVSPRSRRRKPPPPAAKLQAAPPLS